MAKIMILLVDDDEVVRYSLCKILEADGFVVTTAANVSEALSHINSTVFDVLLTDLHMPGAGDGLTVVSAMRHSNPKAVTMVLSAFPEMEAAARAILQQTDQILVKPMEVMALVKAIKQRVKTGAPLPQMVETVAEILQRSVKETIQAWYGRIKTDKKVMEISMTFEQRTCHLPQVLRIWSLALNLPNRLGARNWYQKRRLIMESIGKSRDIPQPC